VLPHQVNVPLMAGTTTHVAQRAVSSADSSLPAIGDGLQNEQAWKDTLVLYKANPKVPPAAKDFMRSTHPKDTRKYLEETEQQQKKSKISRIARGIKRCVDALIRYERALDMFTQAGGMSGCAVRGSIRLAGGWSSNIDLLELT
jgi:hypothetical protein